MVHHPGRDDRMVAGEGPGDVLGALPGAEPDLFLLDVDRVPAELEDRHFHRIAGPGRRFLENQGNALAGERQAEVGKLRQGQDLLQARRSEVGDGQEMGHQLFTLLTMVPIPSSVRSSIRRACGTRPSMMCAVATPASTASAQARSLGIMPLETLS
jgi:hypothetical protein